MTCNVRKVKDGKVFTLYLDKAHLDHIKRVAHRMSVQEMRDISTCEAIRMALEMIYPLDQQLTLFDKKKPLRRLEKYTQSKMSFAELVS